MRNIDELKAEIQIFSSGKKKALKYLPAILDEDEHIEGITEDTYKGKMGLWAFTNKRILFVNNKMQKQWLYDDILELNQNEFIIFKDLCFIFPDEKITIDVNDSKIIYPRIFAHVPPFIIGKSHKITGNAVIKILIVIFICYLINGCFLEPNNKYTPNTSTTSETTSTSAADDCYSNRYIQ